MIRVFDTGSGVDATVRGPMPAEAGDAAAFAVTVGSQNGAKKPKGAEYLPGAVS
jgi:hypothetical protein